MAHIAYRYQMNFAITKAVQKTRTQSIKALNIHAIRKILVKKFKGSEGERLGQLVVTPEVVVSKINNMKENKSPGVDGISPKILKETVEQISTPLAHVFTMSLKEGIVPFEWKEANIIPLFKKGSRNKSVNYRPVSLTSVICKLLETIIRDHKLLWTFSSNIN